jgi:O-antigen ligase
MAHGVATIPSFRAPAPRLESDLSRRLFNLSGGARWTQWRVAWSEYEADPWLASGAGSYEDYWLQHRPVAGKVKDAHSLYLETLAELGPVGLGLLVAALGVPFLAALRTRDRGLVPTALGAYSAYVVHAAVDWDWEMPALTLATLFCGAAGLAASRGRVKAYALSARFRIAGIFAAGVLGLGVHRAHRQYGARRERGRCDPGRPAYPGSGSERGEPLGAVVLGALAPPR